MMLQSKDCPRDNLYRRMLLHFKIQFSAGANIPVTGKNNDILNLIKKITLYYDGTETKLTLSAVDKYKLDQFELGTKPKKTALDIPAANADSDVHHYYAAFDFANNRKRLSDFTALFDAPRKSSVELHIEWGDAGDVFVTQNNGSVKATTECDVVLLEAFEDGRPATSSIPTLDQVRDNLTDIRIGVQEVAITGAHSSFDDDIQELVITPTPVLFTSMLIQTLKNTTDKNPSYDDDVVTQIKLLNTEGGGELISQDSWDNLVAETKTDFTLESLPAGSLYLDWLDQRQGGLRNFDVEALKLRILTKAPTAAKNNAIRIIKQYIPAAPTA